eukprot:c12167_g1_i1 orf=139-1164(+)
MDRFEWLKCQPWLLPCPRSVAAAVDWIFEGFASFYTATHPHQLQDEQDEALSDNAAHLFFSVQEASSLDPAQLALQLGLVPQSSPRFGRDVVLSFDNSSCYILDFKQVLGIIKWKQEQGCKICKESILRPAGNGRENTCACQLLPLYVTVRLQHVSMIIYSRNLSSESSSPEILGAIDVVCKAFEEEKVSSCNGVRKIGSAVCTSANVANLSGAYSSSKKILEQFMTKLDCMSECALGAMNVCDADAPWMIKLLHVMMQCVADRKERSLQSKCLQSQLQSYLKFLEDEEQRHISSIWATSCTQQQEARADAVTALEHTIEQKKQLEEAFLWLELVNDNVML